MCAGYVSSVDDEKAMITDSFVELRIPFASAGDCAVVTLAEQKVGDVDVAQRYERVHCHAGHSERSVRGTLTEQLDKRSA